MVRQGLRPGVAEVAPRWGGEHIGAQNTGEKMGRSSLGLPPPPSLGRHLPLGPSVKASRVSVA